MFEITTEAEDYIADLFEQQDEKDLSLKIGVDNAGTPNALVSFNFCFPKDLGDEYQKFEYKGFDSYINKEHFEFLKGSNVELKDEGNGKKLTILAPNAKGTPPADDASLEEKIKWTIAADVTPMLASHGGFVELVEITGDKDVVLNFGGGCQGCSSVKVTLKSGVEGQLKSKHPEIRNVLDATDHSETTNSYM
jgi:Fe/S biogenesis protein NfuA